MLFRINEIGLFQEDKKNIIKFNDSINFISGDSNTGKSSIGEIIDYCMGSSNQTIPKGKIVNEIDIFAINITLNTYNIIIARNRYNCEIFNGKRHLFLFQNNNNISLSDLDTSWFSENKQFYMKRDDFLELEIIKYFPSFPPKTRMDGKEMVRPSIRNMPPFIFQTQDIIKNKTQLFYQMNNGNKIKGIKRDFELFLGLVEFSVYILINRKNELIKEIRKIKNYKSLYEEELKNEYTNLKSHYFRLFSHLNRDIDIEDIDINDLKDINYLKQFKIEYIIDSDILKQIDLLETKVNHQSRIVEELKIVYSNIKNQIKHIETAQNSIVRFIDSNEYTSHCPVCNSNIENKFEKFIEAKRKIKEEENFLNSYNTDILREREVQIKVKLDQEKQKLSQIISGLSKLKEDVHIVKDIESKKNILSEIKGRIQQTVEQIEKYEKNIETQNKLEKLEEELEEIEDKLKKINIKKRRQEAEYLIGLYATEVLKELPFDESDYGIPNLKFDIKNINMYQQGNKDIYYLSDIGSAENHLSFHIATFLGLHKYILNSESSILPSFIFLDQPSQVYFPKEEDFKNDTGDIQKVESIYKTIISFIENWNNSNMFSQIQIIIVDHFYSQEDWYQKYLVEPRWEKEKNIGLIKD